MNNLRHYKREEQNHLHWEWVNWDDDWDISSHILSFAKQRKWLTTLLPTDSKVNRLYLKFSNEEALERMLNTSITLNDTDGMNPRINKDKIVEKYIEN
jgi:hypothetical protein